MADRNVLRFEKKYGTLPLHVRCMVFYKLTSVLIEKQKHLESYGSDRGYRRVKRKRNFIARTIAQEMLANFLKNENTRIWGEDFAALLDHSLREEEEIIDMAVEE